MSEYIIEMQAAGMDKVNVIGIKGLPTDYDKYKMFEIVINTFPPKEYQLAFDQDNLNEIVEREFLEEARRNSEKRSQSPAEEKPTEVRDISDKPEEGEVIIKPTLLFAEGVNHSDFIARHRSVMEKYVINVEKDNNSRRSYEEYEKNRQERIERKRKNKKIERDYSGPIEKTEVELMNEERKVNRDVSKFIRDNEPANIDDVM